MGLYDRDYTQADFSSQHRFSPQMIMPRITPVVKWLLIINFAVYIPSVFSPRFGVFLYNWFSVYPETIGMALQPWRIITYQFLHDISGFGHIFLNMLVLFFFGPMLERIWGGKKFLIFYLICGAAGGLVYPVLALNHVLQAGPLVGASGSILGMLAAGAILFPNSIVLVMFVFPMKLWIFAVILGCISIMNLFTGINQNQGGEIAHLSGMAAGIIYVLSDSWRERLKFKYSAGRWEKKISEQRNLQFELDRILDKVHKSGIHSLTFKEKQTLRKATKAEQMKNKL